MRYLERVTPVPYEVTAEAVTKSELDCRHTTVHLAAEGPGAPCTKLFNYASDVLPSFTYSLGVLHFSGPKHKVDDAIAELTHICGPTINFYKVSAHDTEE